MASGGKGGGGGGRSGGSFGGFGSAKAGGGMSARAAPVPAPAPARQPISLAKPAIAQSTKTAAQPKSIQPVSAGPAAQARNASSSPKVAPQKTIATRVARRDVVAQIKRDKGISETAKRVQDRGKRVEAVAEVAKSSVNTFKIDGLVKRANAGDSKAIQKIEKKVLSSKDHAVRREAQLPAKQPTGSLKTEYAQPHKSPSYAHHPDPTVAAAVAAVLAKKGFDKTVKGAKSLFGKKKT